jgi:type II secretory pathway component PulF
MLYAYTAKSKTGELFEGVVEARDRFAAAKEIRTKDSMPISISEKTESSFSFAHLFGSFFSKIKLGEQIVFTKNLSGMLKAGLSLSRALSVLEKQTKNQSMIKVLSSVSSDINSGETLSFGLAKFPNYFSNLFISMSKAGEESGNLAGALTDIGINLEKSNNLNKKIKGALIYPGVIMSAMVVIGVLMFAFVVPTLAGTFRELGVALPASTRVIIWMGEFFSNHIIITFILLISGFVSLFALFRAKFMEKYIDYAVIHIPAIGTLAKELNTARTARTMSSLLMSGVSITRAIEITEDVVQNIYYKKVLDEAKVAVEHGAPFSEAFANNTKLYPVMMSEMVEVGEETGKLSDMLLNVAQFYEEEIENKTKNLSTIIEPFLMIIIGAGVGFFAISMISPLYSILNNIG